MSVEINHVNIEGPVSGYVGVELKFKLKGGDGIHDQDWAARDSKEKNGKIKPGEVVATLSGSSETFAVTFKTPGIKFIQAYEWCPVFAFFAKWILFGWATGYQIKQKTSNEAQLQVLVTN